MKNVNYGRTLTWLASIQGDRQSPELRNRQLMFLFGRRRTATGMTCDVGCCDRTRSVLSALEEPVRKVFMNPHGKPLSRNVLPSRNFACVHERPKLLLAQLQSDLYMRLDAVLKNVRNTTIRVLTAKHSSRSTTAFYFKLSILFHFLI